MKKLVSLLLALTLLLGLSTTAVFATYEDGVYDGSAPGMMGNIDLKVSVEGGKIANIEVVSHNETPGLSDPAFEKVPPSIIEKQGFEDVEVVAGATITSEAIVEAVKNALSGEKPEVSAELPFESADVIVVGAGLAGLSTTVRAAELGLNVLTFEQMPTVGGTAMVAGGTLLGVNTRMQKEAGIEDSPELCFADFVRLGGAGTFNEEIARKMSEISGEAVDWLDDMGTDFGKREPYFGVYQPLNVARNYSGNGGAKAFVAPLAEKIKEYEGKNAHLMLNTTVNSLLVEDGKVVGVKATLQDGTVNEYKAPATVICTGGYGGSEELLLKYNFDNILSTAPHFVTGDGYHWLEELDAAFTNMDFCTSYAGGIRTNADNFLDFCYFGVNNGSLWVDINGKRMADEVGADSKVRSDSWSNAEQNLVYVVFNKDMLIPEAKVFSSGAWGRNPEEFEPFMESLKEKGIGFEANDIAELAEKAGLPVDEFVNTINQYNEGCKSGNDPFGRTEQLVPMENGPFYAVKTMPYVMITSGGPMMTKDCEVINNDGLVIEGVYIAGEIVGMANVGGLNSIGGMGHSNCIVWGKHVAEFLADKLAK